MIRTSSQFRLSRQSKLAQKKLRSLTRVNIRSKWRWRSQIVSESSMLTQLTTTLACPHRRRKGKWKEVLGQDHNACSLILQVHPSERWNTAVPTQAPWKVQSVRAKPCQGTTSGNQMVSTWFSSHTLIASMLTCQLRFTSLKRKRKRGISLSMKTQKEQRGNYTQTLVSYRPPLKRRLES